VERKYKKYSYNEFLEKALSLANNKENMQEFLNSLGHIKIYDDFCIEQYFVDKDYLKEEIDLVFDKIISNEKYENSNVKIVNMKVNKEFDRIFDNNCIPKLKLSANDMWIFTPYNMHDTIYIKDYIEFTYKDAMALQTLKRAFIELNKEMKVADKHAPYIYSALKFEINQDEQIFELISKDNKRNIKEIRLFDLMEKAYFSGYVSGRTFKNEKYSKLMQRKIKNIKLNFQGYIKGLKLEKIYENENIKEKMEILTTDKNYSFDRIENIEKILGIFNYINIINVRR
jgi:hypothetical protein